MPTSLLAGSLDALSFLFSIFGTSLRVVFVFFKLYGYIFIICSTFSFNRLVFTTIATIIFDNIMKLFFTSLTLSLSKEFFYFFCSYYPHIITSLFWLNLLIRTAR